MILRSFPALTILGFFAVILNIFTWKPKAFSHFSWKTTINSKIAGLAKIICFLKSKAYWIISKIKFCEGLYWAQRHWAILFYPFSSMSSGLGCSSKDWILASNLNPKSDYLMAEWPWMLKLKTWNTSCRTGGGRRLRGGRRSLPVGSRLCGLLQVPAVLSCSFLMKHPGYPKGFLVWMQHFQPQGRWDSRSSALLLGRFEIRAWNRRRGMALSLCSVFWVPTPGAAPDTPMWEKIRGILIIFGPSGQKYKVNFKYFRAFNHRVQQRWGKPQLAQHSQEDISKWWGGY